MSERETDTSSPLARVNDAPQEPKRRRGVHKSSDSPLATVAEAEAFLGVTRWTLRRMEKYKKNPQGNLVVQNLKGLTVVRIRGCKFYYWSELRALANPDLKA